MTRRRQSSRSAAWRPPPLRSGNRQAAPFPPAEEQGELRKLWKKLVSLYHPDRFAHEPDWVAHAPRVLFAAPSPKTPKHARRTRW